MVKRWNKAGKEEVFSIQKAGYVMGRTEWDEACTKQINPSANYIHCGETLRFSFYEEASQWNYEECKKKFDLFFTELDKRITRIFKNRYGTVISSVLAKGKGLARLIITRINPNILGPSR